MVRKCAPSVQAPACRRPPVVGGLAADTGGGLERMVEAPGVTFAVSTQRDGSGHHRGENPVPPVAA